MANQHLEITITHLRKKMKNPIIVLLGAGKVANGFAQRLTEKKLPIAQIFNRTETPAYQLATKIGTTWTNDPTKILPNADWYLLSVSDHAIAEMTEILCKHITKGLITHTSGATPRTILDIPNARTGVFYPLQSFSLNQAPIWNKIPLCVDAGFENDFIFLEKMGRRLSMQVFRVNDIQRAHLHLAAVFANNFTNHCFSIAAEIMQAKSLPFSLLHPLMEMTLQKALENHPSHVQTGPALRGDQNTLQKHLDLLFENPAWQSIYQKMSLDINPDLKFI